MAAISNPLPCRIDQFLQSAGPAPQRGSHVLHEEEGSTFQGSARPINSSNQAGATSETLRSLDNILGSLDEAELQVSPAPAESPAETALVQPLYVPGWAWHELCEPRVVPLASNVLYYLLLVVYSSYYVIQLAEGQEVADDVLSRLVNDHTAVASGDTLRLFTCFFVADSLPQLIIALVALATVAAELESLLGYSAFWAVWCLTVLSGSVADAAFSDIPITAGPAAGVAGVAAALLAHHLHNWKIEEGKAFLTLGGTAVAVISALKDAADTDIATDWAALIAGFLAGGFLGWMACPVYSAWRLANVTGFVQLMQLQDLYSWCSRSICWAGAVPGWA
eukprot:gene10570-10729_t